jgi:hypothetical protein
MGMDHVEGGVRETHCVDVCDHQLKISHACGCGEDLSRRYGCRRGINADNPAFRQAFREIEGDGSRPRAHVQQSVAGVKAWKQMGR